jgi:predicted RNA-binding protein associated with RNAse of E/G family
MWSKAKVGLVLGAMATVLSVGSAYAATPAVVTSSDQSAKKDDPDKIRLGVFKTHNGQGTVKFAKGASLSENEQLLSLLKLDAEELQAQLKDGKTLAQIAEAQGVAEDDVISLLTKQHEEQLAKAVEEGKLTQEQADKVKEKTAEMVKNMVENTHQRMGGGLGIKFDIRDNQELLSLLKLDAEELQAQLKDGKTLAQIAEAQGVAEDDVISLLTKQHEEQLAKAVEDGKLTQEQADKVKEKTAEMVKNMVENTHRGMGGKMLVKFEMKDNQELLSLLKLDAEELQAQLKDGKSLAEIAEAQGVAEDDVISLLTKQHEEQLAKAVEEGKLTQEQAEKVKEKTAEMVKMMVEKHKGDRPEKVIMGQQAAGE